MKKGIRFLLGATLVIFMGMGQAFGQVTYDGNGNNGFGDVIGNGSIAVSDDGTTITMVIDRATGNLNDGIVIYIDSDESVNISSTSSLTDSGDDGRKTVSGFDGTNRSAITFPSGFRPDYGISVRSDFAGLFKLVESGSHTFVTSVNLSPTGNSSADTYTIDFDFSEVGLSSDSTVKFVANVVSNTAFRSNEAIGTPISGSNPGQNPVTFSGYNTYQSQVEISGTSGWRLLSIPKTGAKATDISDDGIGAQFTSNTDSATIYTYDDTGSFEAISSSGSTLTDGHGLAVYFFDNTTNGSSELPITLDASGSEPSSDVVVDLYSGATGRFTLVGNPFASNIDLANVSANIAMSSNVSFWDNEDGSYVTESVTGGLVIGPWQGYWVSTGASTSGGELTFGTTDKTSSAADQTHFDKVNPDALKELKFTFESSYNTEKNLTLQIANDASEGWDNHDLLKLGSLLNNNVSASFIGELDGESVLKAIESLPSSLDKEITLPLMVSLTGETQEVKMSWLGIADAPDSWNFFLEDYSNGTKIDLRSSSEYSFTQEGIIASGTPKSVLNPGFGETMKLKSNDTNRFGLTIVPNTAVSNEPISQPSKFELDQNYPNPFNPTTTITYSVGQSGPVNITVYNVMGRKVAELVNATKNAGTDYKVSWNATGQASGIYYYRLTAPGQVLTRQMTLIK